MPQKVLKFTGINRRVNEFQAAGACEELINIRPTIAGAQVVKGKKTIISNASNYKSIVEHKFGSTSNFVATTDSSVIWVSDSGAVNQTLLSGVSVKSVTCAGNVITITNDNNTQSVFRFKDNAYEKFIATVPYVHLSVGLTDFSVSALGSRDSVDDIGVSRNALSAAMSQFYKAYPHGLAGPIVVGCTFELEDGSEVWSTGFSIIDPTKDNRFQSIKNTSTGITVYGAKEARLSFNIQNYSNTTEIKNIKFYSSLPQTPYEIDTTDSTTYYAKKIGNKEINLGAQTMYLQKVISYRQSGDFLLNTETNLAGNELMPVTAGAISRSGDVISYNNRFHYYNSDVMHTLQKPSYGMHSNIELPSANNYIEIRDAKLYVVIDNGKDKQIVCDSNTIKVQIGSYAGAEQKPLDLVYPLAGIKEGYLMTSKSDGTTVWYKIEFNDSEAYNYSCALDVVLSTPCDAPDTTGFIEIHGQSVYLREETNAINVSAQFNPYVFPVSNSYSFGGKILDVVTSYLPISSTQIGQYPITVFTDNGIYALSQGEGGTLYGNVVPLQPLVIEGHAKATPNGIFFLSSKNLYVLVGREVMDVSILLNGKIDTIKSNSAYNTIAYAFIGGTGNLSQIDFRQYADGATLAYDQLNNELLISNVNVSIREYSYVFNLDTKAFHKVSYKFVQEKSSYRTAIVYKGSSKSVVDMHTEYDGDTNIFLQSRPFALEELYTHIQRMIMHVDANLNQTYQKLGLFVFASDNLHDWKCIISAQKKETVLRHIRTNRAAKSYKDYVIILSGTVSTDTDLSDIIADYTVVSRRLG